MMSTCTGVYKKLPTKLRIL